MDESVAGNMTNDLSDVGAVIRDRRLAKRWTIGRLAKCTELSESTIRRVESGKVQPHPDTLVKLTRALDLGEQLRSFQGQSALPVAPQPLGGVPAHRDVGIVFTLALDRAHQALRDVARQCPPDNQFDLVNSAVHDAGLFAERERLLALADLPVVVAGERAFLALIAIRNAVRIGARLESEAYHEPYHRFAEAVWCLRQALRTAYGQAPLTPGALDRTDWTDRERCEACGGPV